MDALTLIELKMQEYLDEHDTRQGHFNADLLMSDLALVLSERCYDEEKASVERIRTVYTLAVKERWHRD